jgi:hypothetical protein
VTLQLFELGFECVDATEVADDFFRAVGMAPPVADRFCQKNVIPMLACIVEHGELCGIAFDSKNDLVKRFSLQLSGFASTKPFRAVTLGLTVSCRGEARVFPGTCRLLPARL